MEKYEERALLQYIDNLLQDRNIHRYLGSNFWEWVTENRSLFGLKDEMETEEFQAMTRRRGADSGNRDALQKSGAILLRDATAKRLQTLRSPRCSSLEKTIQAVAELFHLTANETEFFGLLVRSKRYEYIKELINALTGGRRTHFGNMEYMNLCSRLISMKEKDIVAAAGKDGRLMKCGLVEYENYQDRYDLNRKMNHMINQSPNLKTPVDVKAYLTGPIQKATLKWEDFDHLGQERELLAKIISKAVQTGEKGINIMLYGNPGTGKTQFCKTLTQHLSMSLYSVGEVDNNDGEPSRMERLQSLRMIQSILAGDAKSCALMDEAEDIFGSERNPKLMSKVYMNRQLEENYVPVFWLTNSTQHIDPAFIRRMTYCMEFTSLPEAVQVKMSMRECDKQGVSIDSKAITDITSKFKPSPAVFSGAVRVARLTYGGEEEIRKVIGSVEKLLGGKKPEDQLTQYGQNFSMELLNTDVDLAKITEAIKQKGKMDVSFCLSGPPGTGKSEYARWLAAQLGLPFLSKHVSDLSSKFVGESEKNIAAAFVEAQDRKQLLILDEVDSLLQSRRNAVRSWEISQVNEMLTCMDRHPYPFVCTTNFCENLDEAAFRRFTFKVEFKYLLETQIKSAFKSFFAMQAPNEALRMRTLTPGDFAVVQKKLEYLDNMNEHDVVKLLRQETSVKTSTMQRNAIGFLT